jgi:Na+-translocating ferredoxin:NAD+ oxidoreductase RnfD subunit
MLTRSALFFFAFAMLTEPRTLPFGWPWRIAFGALVGLLCVPGVHIGSLRLAPETALLAGNVFAVIAKRLKKWHSARRYLSATAPAPAK